MQERGESIWIEDPSKQENHLCDTTKRVECHEYVRHTSVFRYEPMLNLYCIEGDWNDSQIIMRVFFPWGGGDSRDRGLPSLSLLASIMVIKVIDVGWLYWVAPILMLAPMKWSIKLYYPPARKYWNICKVYQICRRPWLKARSRYSQTEKVYVHKRRCLISGGVIIKPIFFATLHRQYILILSWPRFDKNIHIYIFLNGLFISMDVPPLDFHVWHKSLLSLEGILCPNIVSSLGFDDCNKNPFLCSTEY